MKKDFSIYEAFFSTNGLTSTSAENVCNLAKEYTRKENAFLDNVTFVKKTVTLISSSEKHEISKGYSENEINALLPCISKVSDAYALISWFREAIKAKKAWISEINDISEKDYCEMFNIEYPERCDRPEREEETSEEDVISRMSIKERNNILTLKAHCSVLGKFIHENGPLSEAREDLQDKILNPCDISGEGINSMILKFEPTVDSKCVEDFYFMLQKLYRDNQSKLNSYLHKIKQQVEQENIEKSLRYKEQMSEYELKFEEYSNSLRNITSQRNAYVSQEVARINALKIVIPNDLLDIYNEISSIGK